MRALEFDLRGAIKNGDLADVEKLLTMTTEVSENIAWNHLLLELAIENGHLDILKRLFQAHEKPYTLAYIPALLIKAAEKGHAEIVNWLLHLRQLGAPTDVNVRQAPELQAIVAREVATKVTFNNIVALKLALQNGHIEIVNRLPDIAEVRTHASPSLLDDAVTGGHINVVERLIKVCHDFAKIQDSKALALAAENGRWSVVRWLLDARLVSEDDVNSNNQVLIRAAENGQIRIVDGLIGMPEIFNDMTVENNAALRLAAKNNHLDVVHRMLSIEKVLAHLKTDLSPLEAAALGGHVEVVNILLKALPDSVKIGNSEVLAQVAKNRHWDIVKALMETSAFSNHVAALNNGVLREAAEDNQWDLVHELLELNQVRDQFARQSNCALVYAVKSGELVIFRKLLDINGVMNGINTSSGAPKVELDALVAASEKGYQDVVRTLLDITVVCQRAHYRRNRAFHLAVKNGHLEIAQMLYALPNIKENANDCITLNLAANNGHLHVVNWLLTLPVIAKDIWFFSCEALECAAEKGHLDVIDRLFEFSEVVEDVPNWAQGVLQQAAGNGHSDIVKRLFGVPGFCDNAINENNVALIKAAACGHLSVVKVLIELQQVSTHAHAQNNKALRLAAKGGHFSTVKRLLEIQAVCDHAAIDNNGALRLAAENGHRHIVKKLLEVDAVRNDIANFPNELLLKIAAKGYSEILYVLAKAKWSDMHDILGYILDYKDSGSDKTIRQYLELEHEIYQGSLYAGKFLQEKYLRMRDEGRAQEISGSGNLRFFRLGRQHGPRRVVSEYLGVPTPNSAPNPLIP